MTDLRAERSCEIINERGMHARAATRLVKLAEGFASEVFVARDELRANAKSVMGVLLLCGSKGTCVTVSAVGVDAQDAVEAIAQLIADRFGEAE